MEKEEEVAKKPSPEDRYLTLMETLTAQEFSLKEQGARLEAQGTAIQTALEKLEKHETRFEKSESKILDLEKASVGQATRIADVDERVNRLEANNLNEKIDEEIAGVRDFVKEETSSAVASLHRDFTTLKDEVIISVDDMESNLAKSESRLNQVVSKNEGIEEKIEELGVEAEFEEFLASLESGISPPRTGRDIRDFSTKKFMDFLGVEWDDDCGLPEVKMAMPAHGEEDANAAHDFIEVVEPHDHPRNADPIKDNEASTDIGPRSTVFEVEHEGPNDKYEAFGKEDKEVDLVGRDKDLLLYRPRGGLRIHR